jgi:hypothetical protein
MTSITVPVGVRQKTTGTGNETKDLRETHESQQEGPNGDREEATEWRTERMANCREMSRCQWKRGNASIRIKAPHHHALTIIMERADPSLVTQGWIDDKPCLMTIDTRAYGTGVRPNIATG